MAENKQQQGEKKPEVKRAQEREIEARERVALSEQRSGDASSADVPAQMKPENQDDSVKYTLVGATGSNKGLKVPYGEKLPRATVPGASVPIAADPKSEITAYPTGGHLPADTREATVVRTKS